MEVEYIPVDKANVPYSADYRIEGLNCRLTFRYNAGYDFFTTDLVVNGVVYSKSEKIVYGKPLFTCCEPPFENTVILPYDLSGNTQRISYENMNDGVYLYVLTNGMVRK